MPGQQTSCESAWQLHHETREDGDALGICFIFFGCRIIVPVSNFEVFSSHGKQHALNKNKSVNTGTNLFIQEHTVIHCIIKLQYVVFFCQFFVTFVLCILFFNIF